MTVSSLHDTVDVAQTPWELDRLLTLLDGFALTRILEIGIWEGGTLWEWLKRAQHVTAVDDTMRPPGPVAWRGWADQHRCDLELLQGSSRNIDIVKQALRHGPYDMVFIDADHTYESVQADWLNYSPMVKPGGMVVFHDIVPRPDYGVDRLWADVKQGRRHLEIVDGGSGKFNGIGVLWL